MPIAGRSSRWARWLLPVAVAALVVIVAYPAAKATFAWFTIPGAVGTIWWPAAGLVLAILIRTPRRWWPLPLVAFGIVTFLANRPGAPWPLAVAYVVSNVFEVAAAGALLVDRRSGTIRLRTPREGARFVVVLAGVVAAGALIIAATCWMFPQPREWYSLTGGYLRTHSLGLIAMAPLLLPRDFSWRPSKRIVESVAVFAAMLVINVVVFWDVDMPSFVVLLPLVWAAVRFDVFQATAAALVTSAMAAFGAHRGTGPFALFASAEVRQLMTQGLIAAATVMTLMLVLAARRRAYLGARVHDSEETIRLMLRDAMVGTYVLSLEPDRLGEIQDVNGAFADLVGYRPDELIGRNSRLLFPPTTAGQEAQAVAWLDEFAHGAADTLRREVAFTTKSGERLWVEIVTTRVRPMSAPPFLFIHVHDLTERERARVALEELAWRDSLTGLPNRALLFDRLGQQLRHCARNGQSAGLIYLDLDRFKPVNDEYGHDAGDAVLVETARRLESAVRVEDTVARIGGDEFAILCARPVTIADVDVVAERARAAMREPIMLPNGVPVSVGISIGTAMTGASGAAADDVHSLLRAADQAMYVDKRGA